MEVMKRKTYLGEIKELDEKNLVVTHFITTEEVDRDNEKVLAKGIKTDAYSKNPVVLWCHGRDPLRGELPIGKNISLEVSEKNGLLGLKATTQFYDDDFCRKLFDMVKKGILNAWSIAFRGQREIEDGIGVYKECELLEYSLVPVPANREALTLAATKGIITHDDEQRILFLIRYKKVIPYKKTPLAPEDTPWDGPKEIREATVDDLKIICTWYDDTNPDAKSSYKLPHHRARDHYCVWNGVRAAMAALFGARGGVDIPESDWDGCYEHLSRHYEDFEKEPPSPKTGKILFDISQRLNIILVSELKEARDKEKVGEFIALHNSLIKKFDELVYKLIDAETKVDTDVERFLKSIEKYLNQKRR